jgi:hypothetical protein
MLGATVVNENTNSFASLDYDYRDTIVASQKVNWRIEDIIGGDKTLDFSKPFMPYYRIHLSTFKKVRKCNVYTRIRFHEFRTQLSFSISIMGWLQ